MTNLSDDIDDTGTVAVVTDIHVADSNIDIPARERAGAPMARSAAEDSSRADALAKFIKQANTKTPGSVFTEFTSPLTVETISTGALSLDFALGAGGIPRGRVTELYGPEGSGKTSLALSVCANAIREGGAVGYIDVEHALNFDHVKWMGVDTSLFAVSQPDCAEDALQCVEEMCETGVFDVVVVDSIASLVPRAELNGEIGDQTMALVGRLMSSAMRRLVGVAARTNTALIMINQLREKPGAYGNPEYTPGGRALKYFASVRLDVRSPASQQIKVGSGTSQVVSGQVCRVKVVKNKIAAPFKTAEYRLVYEQGIDTVGTIVDAAVATGVWYTRPGGMYFDAATGEQIGRGRDAIGDLLRADADMAERVRVQVLERLSGAVEDEAPATDIDDAGVSDIDTFDVDAVEEYAQQ